MFEKLTLNDKAFNVQDYPLTSLGRLRAGTAIGELQRRRTGRGEGPVDPVGRSCSLLIIHCSATLPDQRVTVQDIDRWHRQRGFDCIGYHFYITVDGTIWTGRPLSRVGAHCKGYNAHSIGICYEGGLDEEGNPCDTRTLLQKAALVALINKLREIYPTADVVGHNDLDLHKACPCFSAVGEYNGDER